MGTSKLFRALATGLAAGVVLAAGGGGVALADDGEYHTDCGYLAGTYTGWDAEGCSLYIIPIVYKFKEVVQVPAEGVAPAQHVKYGDPLPSLWDRIINHPVYIPTGAEYAIFYPNYSFNNALIPFAQPSPFPAPEPEPTPEARHTDTEGNVHLAAIERVADAGITAGYPDGSFKPEQVITRGQLATFLVRAMGLEEECWSCSSGPDYQGHAHESSIRKMKFRGIMTTIQSNGNMGPDEPVRRWEMADYITMATVLPIPVTNPTFPDVDSEWRKPTNVAVLDSIQRAVEGGIATGYPDGTFRPHGYVTRAQMATFITRAFNL